MSKINIPSKVLPGFEIISKLSKEKTEDLISILKVIDIGISFEELDIKLQELFDSENSKHLVYTFISFTNLFETYNDFDKLASNLATSYSEIEKIGIDVQSNLYSNLRKIFSEANNLLITLKAKDLALENENTFTSIKVITDIRPVFNFELNSENKAALILHKMHLTFQRGNSAKDIFISIDLEDLKQLSKSIERAIKKDEIIRKENKLNFKFAN